VTPRLLLARHGRVSPGLRVGWADAAGFQRWREAYDAAGLSAVDEPPADLLERAARVGIVVSSDAPRAFESARCLTRSRTPRLSPLLRETVLEIPKWLPWRWPVAIWEAAVHAQWGARIVLGVEATPAERSRANDCAAWLAALSGDEHDVLAVTHGVFRRLLARALVESNWRLVRRTRGYSPWSVWELGRAS
jgi:broad specificity phosphatase PhoE